ncbi:MAG: hypothetical protein IJV83_03825 [Clostridia bacterium]|nr:hypothetical protein [Clostridia bacterium]
MKRYQVVASLKMGRVYSRFIRVIALIGSLLGVLMFPLAICILIIEKDPAFFCLVFFAALVMSGCIYTYIKLVEVHRHVLLVFKDGYELDGDTMRTCINGNILDERLTVKFFYQGKKYVKISDKPNIRKPFLGYKAFRRYMDKSIRIFYSETQDDVLIVK